ncbi:MAG: GNAT family N-acetyltransferase [Tepidisphaeraceae bacterium]
MPLPDYLPGRFALARGRPSDYFDLEHFHYLPRRPATYADVWVVTYAERTTHEATRLAAEWLHGRETLRFAQHDPLEARWSIAARRDDPVARADARGAAPIPRQAASLHPSLHEWLASIGSSRVVAVGVLSFPSFRSTPRERVLELREMTHKERLRFTNAHVRTISRVVVHPQFRALGLASELVRTLIAHCPTRYVEASAVMARVHPFFAAAGMRAVPFDSAQDGHADESDRPAYFIFDKEEGSPCASEAETK